MKEEFCQILQRFLLDKSSTIWKRYTKNIEEYPLPPTKQKNSNKRGEGILEKWFRIKAKRKEGQKWNLKSNILKIMTKRQMIVRVEIVCRSCFEKIDRVIIMALSITTLTQSCWPLICILKGNVYKMSFFRTVAKTNKTFYQRLSCF